MGWAEMCILLGYYDYASDTYRHYFSFYQLTIISSPFSTPRKPNPNPPPVFSKGEPLHNPRHPPLNPWLAQTRNQQRPTLLHRRPKNRKHLRNNTIRPIRLLDQIHCHAPPGQDGREDPEIRGGFHARMHAAAVGEEAAGDCGADGEEGQDAAEDYVAGCCCEGLLSPVGMC